MTHKATKNAGPYTVDELIAELRLVREAHGGHGTVYVGEYSGPLYTLELKGQRDDNDRINATYAVFLR